MLHRYDMSNLLVLTKWPPNVRMAISSLQMTCQAQQPYLNSLCTFYFAFLISSLILFYFSNRKIYKCCCDVSERSVNIM